MGRVLLLCCLLLPALPALAEPFHIGDLTVTEAWSRATAGPGNAVAYVTIRNDGPQDWLTGASCNGATGTTMNENKPEIGMIRGMKPMGTDLMPVLTELDIPAQSTVTLKPGGLHLMLEDLREALKVGDEVHCILQFRTSGPMDITLMVGPPGATTPPARAAAP